MFILKKFNLLRVSNEIEAKGFDYAVLGMPCKDDERTEIDFIDRALEEEHLENEIERKTVEK